MNADPILIGDYRADYREIPYVSGFLGGRVAHICKWVITKDGAFVATAETPSEVAKLVQFAQRKVA